MADKNFKIYSAIKPSIEKNVSADELEKYVRCKFWKASREEADLFYCLYIIPVHFGFPGNIVAILSGQLFEPGGLYNLFDEIKIMENIYRSIELPQEQIAVSIFTEQALKRFIVCLYDSGIDLKQSAIFILGKLLYLVHGVGPIFFKIINAIITDNNESYPLYGLIDDVVNWAKLKNIIDVETTNLIEKEIATTRITVPNNTEESFLKEIIELLIDHHVFIFYNDAQALLFPEYNLLAELKEAVLSEKIRAYSSLNEEQFYLHTTTLLKWLMQKGYILEPLTDAFRKIKIELIKESMIPYDGRFNSLQKLIQQGADRDDLLYEALHEKPLYWKYPKDCKCKRNLDNSCICTNGVRWEESKPWIKHNLTATQRLDGFGQLKKNESDDTFGCGFGGLTINMLRHNKLLKTTINHYRIELVPTQEEIIYGLQPHIKVSQSELMTAIADDRLGFLEEDILSGNMTQTIEQDNVLKQKINNDEKLISTSDSEETNECIFSQKGEYYEIKFAQEEYLIKTTYGLIYIDHLIKQPNKDHSIFELRALTHKSEISTLQENALLFDEDSNDTDFNLDDSYHHDVLDPESIELFNTKLQEIEKQLKITDSSSKKYEQLIKDKNWIESELNKNFYKRSSRSFNNQSESVRKAVSKAINSALNKIKNHSDVLYDFLSFRIKTESCYWTFKNNF